jgi:hypothetical protein
MGMLAVGLYLLSRLDLVSTSVDIALSLLVTGLGIGIFISPNSSALLGSAPVNRQGIAAGLLATARNVGMVLGVGFAGAIFTTVLARVNSSTPGLFMATQTSFQAIVFVALAGILSSSIRGSHLKQRLAGGESYE